MRLKVPRLGYSCSAVVVVHASSGVYRSHLPTSSLLPSHALRLAQIRHRQSSSELRGLEIKEGESGVMVRLLMPFTTISFKAN